MVSQLSSQGYVPVIMFFNIVHLFLQRRQSQNSCHVQTFFSEKPSLAKRHMNAITLPSIMAIN